jgi:hypothetical protein
MVLPTHHANSIVRNPHREHGPGLPEVKDLSEKALILVLWLATSETRAESAGLRFWRYASGR